MRMILIAGAALALAGCQPAVVHNAAEANEAVAVNDAAANDAEANAVGNASGEGNVLATVLGMNDRQRNVVLVRAIMDAGLKCDGVKSSARVNDQRGLPAWKAECVNGSSHIIAISPAGDATVLSRAGA